MANLCGKGIWLAHSHDLQRAAEMAAHIEATHLLVKIGHGPIYFPETTRNLIVRIRSIGFHPAAWLPITNQAPKQTLRSIVKALDTGYEAIILFFGTSVFSTEDAKVLADALDNVDIPRTRLYLSSPPLSYMAEVKGMDAIVPFCQGGWMPRAFGTWGGSAEEIIDRDIYQALGDLSLLWGKTPDVYPVLSPACNTEGTTYLPEEFIPWVEGITRHGVDFFSIYHTANTEKALWSILKSVNITCREAASATGPVEMLDKSTRAVALPQPVFIVAKAGDTVWGIITRHSLTKQIFWAWNAHLWDDRGLPRDPDYLQEGWRIRVK